MIYRIVGDVHGIHDVYHEVIQDSDYSIQIGDMGFDYSHLNNLDGIRHKFLGGNHDNYDTYYKYPHNLGDYGLRMLGELDFFFVRGAFSIDKRDRILNDVRNNTKTWWTNEELTYQEMNEAICLYEIIKPSIVITHECPRFIIRAIGDPKKLFYRGFNPDKFRTNTGMLLESMFEIHKPDLWIFGHHHMDWCGKIHNTIFKCINILRYIDICPTNPLQFLDDEETVNDWSCLY